MWADEFDFARVPENGLRHEGSVVHDLVDTAAIIEWGKVLLNL